MEAMDNKTVKINVKIDILMYFQSDGLLLMLTLVYHWDINCDIQI